MKHGVNVGNKHIFIRHKGGTWTPAFLYASVSSVNLHGGSEIKRGVRGHSYHGRGHIP